MQLAISCVSRVVFLQSLQNTVWIPWLNALSVSAVAQSDELNCMSYCSLVANEIVLPQAL